MKTSSTCTGRGSDPATAIKRQTARVRPLARATLIELLACATMLAACSPTPQSPQGFRLPDGDAARGRQAFTALHCNSCHTVAGTDIEYVGAGAPKVALGGTTTYVRTYGELVTSIINPSHKLAPGYPPEDVSSDGESLMAMARLNEAMTVQQLIDLVAFLQDQYEVVLPEYYPYTRIYP